MTETPTVTSAATGFLVERLDALGSCRVTIRNSPFFPLIVRTLRRVGDHWMVTTNANGMVTTRVYADYRTAAATVTAMFTRSLIPHPSPGA